MNFLMLIGKGVSSICTCCQNICTFQGISIACTTHDAAGLDASAHMHQQTDLRHLYPSINATKDIFVQRLAGYLTGITRFCLVQFYAMYLMTLYMGSTLCSGGIGRWTE